MPHVIKEEMLPEKIALIIEVTESELAPYLQKTANQLSKDKPVKGFRPGKIDIETAKKLFGPMELYEASLDFVVRGTLPSAVEDNNIQFIGSPDISVLKCAPGNPVSYKAVFLLAPQVTLADESKIKIESKEVIIDEKRISKVLEDVRESRASESAVDREVREGDRVSADVSMFLDSVPLDGGQMKNQQFIVGKDELWEGFGTRLVGIKKKDKKEFTVTISKNHFQKNIAGKNVEFSVVIHEIFERKLSELSDEFAKGLGAFKNLDDLKAQLKKNLEHESAIKEQERIENEFLTKLVEQSTFTKIPDEMLEKEKEQVLAETKHMIQSRGMEWQGYLDHLKRTEDEIREGFTGAAERRIKNNLVLVAIAEKRGVSIGEDEITKEYEAYAQYNPDGVKDANNMKRIREHIKVMLSHRKALAQGVDERLNKK